MATILLIDADILVYEAAFTCQTTTWWYKKRKFRNKYSARKYVCEALGKDVSLLREDVHVDSVDHLHSVIDHKINSMSEKVSVDGVELFLTGSGNFRENIAVTAPYKGNRNHSARPVLYEEARAWLISEWNAHVVNGLEADDAIGLAMTLNGDPFDLVIASIDKDLDNVSGPHYNWRKESTYHVSEFEAFRNYAMQMLSGDSADNIKGIPGCGPVRARNALAGCASDFSHILVLTQIYIVHFGSAWEDRMNENHWLLWIKNGGILDKISPVEWARSGEHGDYYDKCVYDWLLAYHGYEHDTGSF